MMCNYCNNEPVCMFKDIYQDLMKNQSCRFGDITVSEYIRRIKIMEDTYKIVHFDKYCDKCMHANKKECEEPCDECLMHSINLCTHKPVKFEEKK